MTPAANPHLLGHEAAERALRDAHDRGRLHHAILLTGPEGIGRATLAHRFARALLAGFPEPGLRLDPAHPVFRRVAAGGHADLRVVARPWDEKKKQLRAEITVDEVRTLAGFLALTPAEGGWRVAIVDGADLLNRNAANALLKMLEEPPPRTVLILTAAAPGRLLPTIRSRCRRLPLQPLADREVEAVLRLAGHEALAGSAALVRAADGSPGRVVAWAAAGLDGVVEQLAGLLDGEPADPARLLAVAEAAGARDGGLPILVAALRDALHRRTRASLLDGTGAPVHNTAADDWSALGTLERETTRFHLDKRQAVAAALELAFHR